VKALACRPGRPLRHATLVEQGVGEDST